MAVNVALGSDVTYEGIGVDFAELARVVSRVLRRPGGVALISHEARLTPGCKLAADGGADFGDFQNAAPVETHTLSSLQVGEPFVDLMCCVYYSIS